jgi:putative ABC transport system substrate-binding protein
LVEGAVDEASLGRAFETLPRDSVSGLIIGAISEFIPFAPAIAKLALAARLPAISGQNLLTEAGLLMSYGPSYPELFRRAAGYVGEIVNGADPGLLPVDQPTKYELVVNLRTARALGVTLTPEIMLLATGFID